MARLIVISHRLAALKKTSASGCDPVRWLPRAAGGYPAAVSPFAAEDPLNLLRTHRVEIVGRAELSAEKPDSADLFARWRIERGDFDHGLASFGDNKRLSSGGFVHQTR